MAACARSKPISSFLHLPIIGTIALKMTAGKCSFMYAFISTRKKKSDIPEGRFFPVDPGIADKEAEKIFWQLRIPIDKIDDYKLIGYLVNSGDGDCSPLFQKGGFSDEKELFFLKRTPPT